MSTILHRIKAYLYENLLTKENPHDYMARVVSERSLSVQDICVAATTRGDADISAAAMEHAVNLFLKEMGYQLCDGFAVNTGWFTAAVHIRGVFDAPDEAYDPEKHTLLFELHQGALLRKELQSVDVQIQGLAPVAFSISRVIDVKTGSVNDLLTPNRNLRIAGHRIKIAGDSDDNGVYFINQQTQERTKVDPSDVVTNNPSEVVIVIPELTPETYKVEITTQYSVGGSMLKDPHTTLFNKPLTVQ